MQAVHLDPANVKALSLTILRRQVSELASPPVPMAVAANDLRVAIGGNAR